MADIDPAILAALDCDASEVQFEAYGSLFSTVGKLKVLRGQREHEANYFLKCAKDETLISGEAASYRAISSACPSFCPSVIATGRCSDSDAFFLVSTFLSFSSPTSLAQNLAKLHAATNQKFGFHVPTCCADTVQDNTWTPSWRDFFIERRLKPIAQLRSNADDAGLQDLVVKAAEKAVPRLLDVLQIQPALIHGDLWSGNARGGQVFDACCSYAHSEFEVAIMTMFGGFAADLEEYHQLRPRDEPAAEYDDRIALYMCYHQLNHSGTGQGDSYKSSAKRTLQKLIDKYG